MPEDTQQPFSSTIPEEIPQRGKKHSREDDGEDEPCNDGSNESSSGQVSSSLGSLSPRHIKKLRGLIQPDQRNTHEAATSAMEVMTITVPDEAGSISRGDIPMPTSAEARTFSFTGVIDQGRVSRPAKRFRLNVPFVETITLGASLSATEPPKSSRGVIGAIGKAIGSFTGSSAPVKDINLNQLGNVKIKLRTSTSGQPHNSSEQVIIATVRCELEQVKDLGQGDFWKSTFQLQYFMSPSTREFFEDDADAMLFVLKIAHDRGHEIKGCEEWLFVSWTFGFNDSFAALYAHMVRHCRLSGDRELLNSVNELVCGDFSQPVIESIRQSRLNYLKALLHEAYLWASQLTDPSLNCCHAASGRHDSSNCTNLRASAFYRGLRQIGLPTYQPAVDALPAWSVARLADFLTDIEKYSPRITIPADGNDMEIQNLKPDCREKFQWETIERKVPLYSNRLIHFTYKP
ncbi:hypothetical protein BCR34DRAFT_648728 [Clohesyomyces aquaticus]|uniref:Uncharacterized protein n=1 Tax=Clohesyomyces aquaticus TaxID=1231657 RepID=A0A1Y1ZUB3_9PLEO|nr:hypothetical protein BCR34DRAFT_648728 [Clohesyomyces aquaticus]